MTLSTSSLSFCYYGNIITEENLCLTGAVWTETEGFSGDDGWGEGKRETDARVCQSTPWDPIKLNHPALTGKHEYSAKQLMNLCPPDFFIWSVSFLLWTVHPRTAEGLSWILYLAEACSHKKAMNTLHLDVTWCFWMWMLVFCFCYENY